MAKRLNYLVVFRCKLVEALLDDVVTVEVLDEHNDVQAECNDDEVNLSIVSSISLLFTVSVTSVLKPSILT